MAARGFCLRRCAGSAHVDTIVPLAHKVRAGSWCKVARRAVAARCIDPSQLALRTSVRAG